MFGENSREKSSDTWYDSYIYTPRELYLYTILAFLLGLVLAWFWNSHSNKVPTIAVFPSPLASPRSSYYDQDATSTSSPLFNAYEASTNRFITTRSIELSGSPKDGDVLSKPTVQRAPWSWNITPNKKSSRGVNVGTISWAGTAGAGQGPLCWEIQADKSVALKTCDATKDAQLWESPLDSNIFVTSDQQCIALVGDHLQKTSCTSGYPIKVATIRDNR